MAKNQKIGRTLSNCLRPSRHRAHTCQKWPAGLGENSVLCLEFRHQKILKNKTECWPFFGFFFDGFSSKSTLNSTKFDRKIGKTLLEYRVKYPPKLAPNAPRINRKLLINQSVYKGLRGFFGFCFGGFSVLIDFKFHQNRSEN